MLVIHPDSHVDHVPAELIEFVKRVFADTRHDPAGNPQRRVDVAHCEIPSGVKALDCALYGPRAGDRPVPEEEVQYVVRPGRTWPSRMVDRPLRKARMLTMVAGPHDDHDLVLYTAYGGPPTPREVHDPNLKEEDRRASVDFWRDHALALGT